MTGNNQNLDHANVIACKEFGEIPSICSQDIEREINSEINQGP